MKIGYFREFELPSFQLPAFHPLIHYSVDHQYQSDSMHHFSVVRRCDASFINCMNNLNHIWAFSCLCLFLFMFTLRHSSAARYNRSA